VEHPAPEPVTGQTPAVRPRPAEVAVGVQSAGGVAGVDLLDGAANAPMGMAMTVAADRGASIGGGGGGAMAGAG
jgi:hypothetical protein